MKVEVVSPASITCMFTPERSDNPKLSGSYGVGIALKNGSRGICEENNEFRLIFKNCGEVRTVKTAISMLCRKMNGEDASLPASIVLEPEYPVGCGFGMSASLTLSALIAVSKLHFGLDLISLADIAHEAEVLSSTGLGDVTTQLHGGIVCRLKAASPSLATVKKVDFPVSTLDILVLGELDTKEALKEYDFSTGMLRMKEFLKKPDVRNLFHQSKMFALESGVMDDEILDVVEAVEAAGGLASMVMLGKAVFAVNGFEAMREFGEPFRAEIDFNGLFHGIF